MSSGDCQRLSVTEAIDRLRDWVINLDIDGLARMVSEHCPPQMSDGGPVVVFDDQGGDDDSAPYMDGRRCRWVCVPESPDVTTTGN